MVDRNPRRRRRVPPFPRSCVARPRGSSDPVAAATRIRHGELLTSGYRHLSAIFPDQPWKFKCPQETFCENFRLANQTQKPAEIKPVRPIGDRLLVAR